MEKSEKKAALPARLDDPLAKDVAGLYSWANLEGIGYRDFSRQRKHPPKEAPSVEDVKTVNSAEPYIENSPAPMGTPETKMAAVSVPAEPLSSPAIRLTPPASTAVDRVESVVRIPVGSLRPEITSASMAVYSLAGGVGRTTLTANVGRALCSLQEQVLLVDASASGLLPFFFGANELRPGLRTFVDTEMKYPSLRVLGANEITTEWLEHDVKPAMCGVQRTIFDLGPASTSVLTEIFAMCGVILIPLLPDLNSTLTVSRIEASLKDMADRGMKIPTAYYVFNRFDGHSAMHQQAHALVVRQCADRLLPITIGDGAVVNEAVASRMTLADHSPDSELTRTYLELALWLRKIAPINQSARLAGRWSER